jgi:hypothetical protein
MSQRGQRQGTATYVANFPLPMAVVSAVRWRTSPATSIAAYVALAPPTEIPVESSIRVGG